MENNIKVAIRVRPLVDRELNEKLPIYWQIEGHTILQIKDSRGCQTLQPQSFTFDHIFDETQSNCEIFKNVVEPMVKSGMAGYNSTVFAYGQTSSGKTYTMLGCQNDPGIISLTVENIFHIIDNNPERKFLLRISYIDIYNNSIRDLLDESPKTIQICEDASGTICIRNVMETIIHTTEQAHEVIKEGEKRRKYATTSMNQRSSRSHTIFRIIIESTPINDDPGSDLPVHVSHLNLVDLAGSERVSQTKATGLQLREGGHINQSLHSLSRVIRQLSTGNYFTSFRDSQLTRILKESLGGNAKTLIVGTITPASLDDSVSTLLFISQAKMIENKPIINKILDSEALIKRYMEEEQKLKQQLTEMMNDKKELEEKHNRTVMDLSRKLHQLTQQFITSNNTPSKQEERRRHTMGATTFQRRNETENNNFVNPFDGNCIPNILHAEKIIAHDFSEINIEENIDSLHDNECDQLKQIQKKLQSIIFGNLEGSMEKSQMPILINSLWEIYEAFCNLQGELDPLKQKIGITSGRRICSICNQKQSSSTESLNDYQKNRLSEKSVKNNCTLSNLKREAVSPVNSSYISVMDDETESDPSFNESEICIVEDGSKSAIVLSESSVIDLTASILGDQDRGSDKQHKSEEFEIQIEIMKEECAALRLQLEETKNVLEETEDQLLSVNEQLDLEEKEKNKYKDMIAATKSQETLNEALQLENAKLKDELQNIKINIPNYSMQNVNTLERKLRRSYEDLNTTEEESVDGKPNDSQFESYTEEDSNSDSQLIHSILNDSEKHTNNMEDIMGLLMDLKTVLLSENCSNEQMKLMITEFQKLLDSRCFQQNEIAAKNAQLESYIAQLQESITNQAGSIKSLEDALMMEHKKNLELSEAVKQPTVEEGDSNRMDDENEDLVHETNDNKLATEYSDLHQIEQENDTLKEKIESLRNKVKNKNKLNLELMDELNLLQQTCFEQEQVNTSLMKQKDDAVVQQMKLNEACVALGFRIAEQEQVNVKLAEENNILQNKLTKLMEENEKLTEDHNLQQSQFTKQGQENTNLTNKKLAFIHKMTEQESTHKQLLDENVELSNKVSQNDQDNKDLMEIGTALQINIDDGITLNTELTETISLLKVEIKELESIKETFEKERSQLNNTTAELDQLNSKLAHAIVLLENDIVKQKEAYDKLSMNLKVLKTKVNQQQALYAKLSEEVNLLQSWVAEQEVKIAHSQREREDLIVQRQKMKVLIQKEASVLQQQFNQREETKAALTKKKAALDTQIIQCDKLIVKLKDEIKLLEYRHIMQMETNAQLAQKVTQLKESNQQLLEGATKLENKIQQQEMVEGATVKEESEFNIQMKFELPNVGVINQQVTISQAASNASGHGAIEKNTFLIKQNIKSTTTSKKEKLEDLEDMAISTYADNCESKSHPRWRMEVQRLQDEVKDLDNEIITMYMYMQDLEERIRYKNRKIKEVKSQHEQGVEVKRRRSAAHDSFRNLEEIEEEQEPEKCPRCTIVNSGELNRALYRELRRKNMELAKLEDSLKTVTVESSKITDRKDLDGYIQDLKNQINKLQKEIETLKKNCEEHVQHNRGTLGHRAPEIMKGPSVPIEYYHRLLRKYEQTKAVAVARNAELKKFQVSKASCATQTGNVD